MSQHPEIKHISEALREGFSLKREVLPKPFGSLTETLGKIHSLQISPQPL